MESSIGHSPSVTVHYDNLPYGCGNKFDPRGRALYIDHNTKCTTLERPLPPIEDHCKHNDPSDNRIVASVNNLLRLTSDLNSWTSKFVITHGDQSIDVSSAAQGDFSSSPSGIHPHQNIPYPYTKYCFDDKIFGGIEAKDLLIKMLKSPNCIDGCKLVTMRQNRTQSHFRKGAWTFVCSHGIVMNDMDESHFNPDSVGKSNVPIQGLKRTKSRGMAVKGEMMFLVMNSYVPMNS
jgi:hypothetical protein